MENKYLLAKWLNDELTDEELIAFKKSPQYAEYEKIKIYSQHLIVDEFDDSKILENVFKSKPHKSKLIPISKNWILRIAAILIVGFGMGYFIFQNNSTQKEFASNGFQKTFSLPDNSEVVLNSGSEIYFKKRNWGKNRQLKLKGEAFFKVAKGETFEVQTDLGKVSVLGTQFNVKSRKNKFDVSCYEGKVKVFYKGKEIILTRGMQVTFEKDNQFNSLNSGEMPEWMENKIVFNNDSLETVIEEMERQYNVEIVNNSFNKNDLFTGKIPSNQLDIALEIVVSTYNIKYRKLSDKKIIFE